MSLPHLQSPYERAARRRIDRLKRRQRQLTDGAREKALRLEKERMGVEDELREKGLWR